MVYIPIQLVMLGAQVVVQVVPVDLLWLAAQEQLDKVMLVVLILVVVKVLIVQQLVEVVVPAVLAETALLLQEAEMVALELTFLLPELL